MAGIIDYAIISFDKKIFLMNVSAVMKSIYSNFFKDLSSRDS